MTASSIMIILLRILKKCPDLRLHKAYCFAFLFTCFILNCLPIFSQDIKMNYSVKKGNKVIGSFTVEETTVDGSKTIKLESHIKTSFVVSITVDAKEESIFQNGILSQSTVFRKVNGDEKVNKKHRLYNNGYVIETGRKRDTLCCTQIIYNLMNLYCTEPVTIGKVYSDNYEKFLVIQKTEPHIYRIDVPDGSYNKYFYNNGKCTKVEIHQSLYTIVMFLT